MRRRFLFATLPLLGLVACQMPATTPARRTVVYFTADSAALDENAATLVSDVAARAKTLSGPVRVRGFAAPDGGSMAFNRTLALARAQNVADELVAAGVDRSRIRMQPRGEVPFEMVPIESRRVEIIIGE